MSTRTCVVVPYFQREPGILRVALLHALTQVGVDAPHIIVVDDGSPAPPEPEILSLPVSLQENVRLIQQPNAGPGAARNRGLDAVPEDTDFVALLDSDDRWLPEHLQRALLALGAGYDFYFANYFDIGQEQDGFTQRATLQAVRRTPLPGIDDAYAYLDDLRLQILAQSGIETSTVVFRWSRFRDLRFRPDFRDAYEDLLFWFEAAGRTNRIVISWRPEVQYGKGVNLFRSATWGTEGSLKRVVASTRFRSEVRRRFQLSREQALAVRSRLMTNRKDFVAEILHRVRAGKPMLWHQVGSQLRADPATVLTAIPECVRQVLKRATGGGSGPRTE